MNIGSLITHHALYRPQQTAIVFEDQRLTYSEFNRRINRLANALLNLGIGKGDKLATILPNCLELLETYWAAAKIGAVVVPISGLLRGTGLANLLRNSDTAAIITDYHFADELNALKPQLPAVAAERYIATGSAEGYQDYRALTAAASEKEPPAIEVRDDDPFNIIYSSGTTGDPKGIVHSHRVRAMYGAAFASAYRMTPESVTIHAGSIVFNGAFVMLMPSFFLGGTYVLMSQFDPETFIAAVERERATHTMMVPSQIVGMLNSPAFSPDSLKSMEAISSIGAPLHLEHKEKLTGLLPGCFYELYGLTEGFMTVLDKCHYQSKPGSVGVPLPLFEMKIVNEDGSEAESDEVGEITGRSPLLMTEYYKQPELTAQAFVDGWLRTGDLGYLDEDGFLFLVDRKKDLIISGGINVFPKDIEEIIVRHPAVRETAVFGVPSDKWGETPLAAIILKQNAEIDAEELRNWINERVDGKYQRVSKVVLMDDFPRNSAGKTLKREMKSLYWTARDLKI